MEEGTLAGVDPAVSPMVVSWEIQVAAGKRMLPPTKNTRPLCLFLKHEILPGMYKPVEYGSEAPRSQRRIA